MHKYIVYKTTNLINQKFYIGVHKITSENDSYLGSGKVILQAIDRYGKESFKRETLYEYDNYEDAFEKEKEIITEDLINDEKCYNIKQGGYSNFYYVNKHGLNQKNNQHMIHNNKLKNDIEYRKRFIEKITPINQRIADSRKGKPGKNKGCKWIHKDDQSKIISINEIEQYKADGWKLGRSQKDKKSMIRRGGEN